MQPAKILLISPVPPERRPPDGTTHPAHTHAREGKSLGMVRPGKERALASSAEVTGDDEATQQDTRWLQGVNRQLQADAPSHQCAASQAAAAKRKANAMTGEEKAAAERARADRRNAAKRAKRATKSQWRSLSSAPARHSHWQDAWGSTSTR